MAGAAERRADERRRRSSARLMAVQALYQQAMAGTPVPELLAEFHAHRLAGDDAEVPLVPAEAAFFDDVVRGVVLRAAEFDARIASHLAAGWTLERIDPLVRQLLRAGSYELAARPDVPLAAVITEYVDIAHAFVAESEARFVNAILDRLGRELRGAA
jgi:N utilization substance protein B